MMDRMNRLYIRVKVRIALFVCLSALAPEQMLDNNLIQKKDLLPPPLEIYEHKWEEEWTLEGAVSKMNCLLARKGCRLVTMEGGRV